MSVCSVMSCVAYADSDCSLCRAVGQEIASLPGSAVVGFIKVSAKPLKNSLSTWASKWSYLFTHYLQVSCCGCKSATSLSER
jgi:hypothetical protein